jgi:hypothetical protein
MVDARYSAGDAAYRCLLGQSVAGSNPALSPTLKSLTIHYIHSNSLHYHVNFVT